MGSLIVIFALFLLVTLSTFFLFFLFLFFHELGHYVTGKIYNSQPSALVLDYYILPGGVALLENLEKTNTIVKLSGLISQTLYVFLLAIIFGIPSLGFWAFCIPFFIFAPFLSLHDIQLVLKNYLKKEKLSILAKITKWLDKRKRNTPS